MGVGFAVVLREASCRPRGPGSRAELPDGIVSFVELFALVPVRDIISVLGGICDCGRRLEKSAGELE